MSFVGICWTRCIEVIQKYLSHFNVCCICKTCVCVCMCEWIKHMCGHTQTNTLYSIFNDNITHKMCLIWAVVVYRRATINHTYKV